VHYWADLQSVHGFRCYDNIAPNAKCQRVLVLALCLVIICGSATVIVVEIRTFIKPHRAVAPLHRRWSGGLE